MWLIDCFCSSTWKRTPPTHYYLVGERPTWKYTLNDTNIWSKHFPPLVYNLESTKMIIGKKNETSVIFKARGSQFLNGYLKFIHML